MQNAITDTLQKLYNMFVDSATTANEKEVAHSKIKTLCKKHKVNMQSFIANCDFDRQFTKLALDKSNAQTEKRKAFEASEVKLTVKKQSRRSLIIEMLFQNSFTKHDINEALIDVYDYADSKANLKAISGTMYDLSTNKDYFFRICDNNCIVTEKK